MWLQKNSRWNMSISWALFAVCRHWSRVDNILEAKSVNYSIVEYVFSVPGTLNHWKRGEEICANCQKFYPIHNEKRVADGEEKFSVDTTCWQAQRWTTIRQMDRRPGQNYKDKEIIMFPCMFSSGRSEDDVKFNTDCAKLRRVTVNRFEKWIEALMLGMSTKTSGG